MKNYKEKLKCPPKEYRPVPFWSWNDKLEPSLLKWQIKEMDRVGLGGYFMHARGGIETEYLSEEWMECIQACIEEGKKQGMNSWIYDEAGWPSGFAGGIVTAMGDPYHSRWMEMKEYTSDMDLHHEKNLLGVFLLNSKRGEILPLSIRDASCDLNENDKIYIITHTSNPYYIDVMNKEAVHAFIQCTHERYYTLFKDEFGTGMKGFFTDEPRLSWNKEGDVPWSYIIPEKFKAIYGYDIMEKLPFLFLECKGYEKVRYDFWKLISDLFVSSYMKQIYEWCDKHNCELTGHVMMEESIFAQMTGTSGVMPFYEYMHIPGIDWLRRMIGSPVVPKQVGSVANQLGKEFVLTESYALCGWNVSFEDLKWIAEWQYVNGVNLMCQHLEGYTLRGLRKRDYPPSLFIQQPWWDEYILFNDYLARLGALLSSGNSAADILLLHPMKSGWVAFEGSNNARIKKLDADFIWASETLSGLHVDYHYGDETLLSKYARVEGDRFIVGQCKYKAVILPSMITLDKTTLRLLQEFIQQGGSVISIGDFPLLCNGVQEDEMVSLQRKSVHVGDDRTALLQRLTELSLVTVSIADEKGEIEEIHYQQRDLGDCTVFFMVNHDRNKTRNALVTIRETGMVQQFIAENGNMEEVEYEVDENSTKLKLEFLPAQSHCIVFDRKRESAQSKKKIQDEIKVTPGEQWLIEKMDVNALTLDFCEYSIDEGAWEGPIPVIKLMDVLLRRKKSCDIALKFRVEIDMELEQNKEIYLVVEKAEDFTITVNGHCIEYRDLGWWKDSSFKKVDIKQYLLKGNNEVILRRNFYQKQKVYDVLFGENVFETEINKLTYDVELESVYIIGDFGVASQSEYICGERGALFTKGPFVITDIPRYVKTGDLTPQGLWFFSGNVTLSQRIHAAENSGERLVIDLEKPDSVLTKVFVNDILVKELLWGPYKVDITEYVHPGDNKLTIQLYGSNRNLLGPHHHIKGEVFNVGPSSFTGKWSWIERETEANVTTEEEMRMDYWREDYCFVRFGLK